MDFLKLFSKNQDEINEYFRLKRYRRYEKYGPKARFVRFHCLMHRILIVVLRLMRVIEKRQLTIIADRRKNKKAKPTIFACTHVGGSDAESAIEAISEPCYLFFGDPGEVYRSAVGVMLALNGVISLETRCKKDRHIAKERGLALLKQGGSLLIFPEGAWNTTENEPCMKLFRGTADFALGSGANIVPLAIERYNNHYYANIGEEICYNDICLKNANEVITELRDTLATLQWEIWEHMGIKRFKSLPKDYANACFYPMFEPVMGYSIQDAIETRFHDKNITEPKEAFAHLDKLIPSKENAFLFRKR